MVANGVHGIKTGSVSFARRGGKDHFNGAEAVHMSRISIAVGIALALWGLLAWMQ